MDVSALVGVLAVLALVAANGFFVAGEFALVKVRATRIEQLVEEGNKTAQIVLAQIRHLDTYIAATQLGITLASLALGWIGEPSLAHLIEPLFARIGGPAAEALTHSVAVTLSFIIITAGHIILGELVPKSIALQRTENAVFFVARPLLIFARLFHPFILLMNGIGNAVVKLFGLQATGEHGSVHSVEELELLVAQSRKGGELDAQEEEMLHHVFDFGEKTVQQVMRPRTEMTAVPLTISMEELRAIFAQEQYTRLPVYDGGPEQIVGMVHLKDFFTQQQTLNQTRPLTTVDILRPVIYVTETSSIENLLTQMRSSRIHLAIAIDEYGATAGMLTLEDIVEEIVGEVQDEFDTREQGIRSEVETFADGTFSVDGLMAIASFADQFGIKEPSSSAHTIAGYVFEHLDRLPLIGDSVMLEDYQLQVEELDHRRIARLHVLLHPKARPEEVDEQARSKQEQVHEL
ncbi:hemolysin family protein [Ktedonosporobacter rubrisoli]|uniref:hemolysin family protein n=1 Tax=Ktedonosporobacter rubrisoli TaxID=2509675 RepID=UPI0013EE4875|nr:hemolysin family protein [Ktedonosporobacter rubrisoli]